MVRWVVDLDCLESHDQVREGLNGVGVEEGWGYEGMVMDSGVAGSFFGGRDVGERMYGTGDRWGRGRGYGARRQERR